MVIAAPCFAVRQFAVFKLADGKSRSFKLFKCIYLYVLMLVIFKELL